MLPGHRRSIRYRGFDYSGRGAYFVTMRLHERGGAIRAPLADIVDGRAELTGLGAVVDRWWRALPDRFAGIVLDEYIVMPDHFHGIIVIVEDRPLEIRSTLGQMMAWFKYNSTKEMNAERGMAGTRVWQRNYWERIIRDERAWNAIRRYIRDNPMRWATG